MNILAKKAVLVTFSTTKWVASKTDKAIARAVEAQHNAGEGAIRTSKSLLGDRGKAAYKRLTQQQENLRAYVNEMTLPWTASGQRILPSALVETFVSNYNKKAEQIAASIVEFSKSYDAAIAEARQPFPVGIGDLFNEGDYPARDDVESRFSVSMSIDSIPDGDNFYSSLPEEVAQELQADLEARNAKTLDLAIRSIYKRIEELVQSLHSRLATEESRKNMRPSAMQESMVALLDSLDAFNLTNDPELTRCGEKLRVFAHADFDLIKNEPEMARRVRESAADLLQGLGEML